MKKTIGIMVFDTIESAEQYTIGLKSMFIFHHQIIEIDARGRMKKIKTVSSGADTEDLDKFYDKRSINLMSPFPGTECYPRIKVLT